MKKLLSLLSVLTISGSALPTTIAASPYQKEEKLNSEINYLKINNLENLNRNKRQNNNNNNISPELKISYEDIDKYLVDLYSIINFLQNRDNIRLINQETTGTTERYSETYFINSNNNNQYFIVPINIENSRRISLVFNSIDFYLQGFIGHPTSNNQTLNVYYYFRDATIRNISGVTSEININFDSTYTSLRGNSNSEILISWDNIVDSFNQVALYGENPDHFNSNTNRINQIKINFIRVILATSEALRFREVRNNIIYNHHNNQTGIWDRIFDRFLRNWDRISRNALEYLIQFGTLIGFTNIHDISIFSRTLSNNFKYCNRGRSIDSNNNEYCFILPEKISYFLSDHSVSKHDHEYLKENDDKFFDFAEVEIGEISPLNYNKIEFFGEQLTKVSWGNDPYIGKKIGNTDLGNNFKNYIYNLDIRDYPKSKYIEVARVSLDDKCEKDGWAWMCHTQKAGITFYWKSTSRKWYIQIILYTWIRSGVTSSGGANWMWIGNGIKLT